MKSHNDSGLLPGSAKGILHRSGLRAERTVLNFCVRCTKLQVRSLKKKERPSTASLSATHSHFTHAHANEKFFFFLCVCGFFLVFFFFGGGLLTFSRGNASAVDVSVFSKVNRLTNSQDNQVLSPL